MCGDKELVTILTLEFNLDIFFVIFIELVIWLQYEAVFREILSLNEFEVFEVKDVQVFYTDQVALLKSCWSRILCLDFLDFEYIELVLG